MGSGFRTFATGEVLTSSNVMNYLMDQTVMSFASAAARDAAVTAPEEGMVAVLRDTNLITIHDGSGWVVCGGYGAWPTFTPVLGAATTNPTMGNSTATGAYWQFGKLITFHAQITVGSTFVAGSGQYNLTLPGGFSSVAGKTQHVMAHILDQSGSLHWMGFGSLTGGSSTISLFTYIGTADGSMRTISNNQPITWAVSDTIQVWGTVEIA